MSRVVSRDIVDVMAGIRVGIAGAVLVAVLGLAGCGGGGDSGADTGDADGGSATSAPEPVATTVEGSSAEVIGDLSYTVWSQIVSGFFGGITTESPLYPVTKIEDAAGSGTIRVYVQEQLSKDEATTVGRHVFTLGAMDNPDLTTVIVQDASGKDTNVFRRDVPGVK